MPCLSQCLDKITWRQLSCIVPAILAMTGQVMMLSIARWTNKVSVPQYTYFVIALLALMLCQELRTLTALLHCVTVRACLSGLCRLLTKAP